MKIICPGLAKTGTTSLAVALRILGFTVHDYIEHNEYNIDEYLEAFDGKMPDFVAMYKDVDATTDTPSCFFWKELHESFPYAKVILTERDNVEVWTESKLENGRILTKYVKHGSLNLFYLRLFMTSTGRKVIELLRKITERFENDQPDKLPSVYLEHNARVKASIPRDQLLLFNVIQGWKPLCEFLGVDVPDLPFPRLNKRQDSEKEFLNVFRYSARLGRKIWNELLVVLAASFVFLGILIYIFVS